MRRSALILTITAAGLAAAAAVAGTASSAPSKHNAVSGNISMSGVWAGAEAKNFNLVLAAFTKANPGVHVKYTSTGDNTPTVLSTAVQGGNPPDLAAISQPGIVKDFANRGALKPITFVKGVMAKYYSPSWITLGTIKGKLYGMVFKGANKSTIWYNVSAFKNAGITPPKTWTELLKDAGTLKASGVPPFAIAGGDGWPLTDIQENIYLRQAGPAKYDQLVAHTIKWTDPSVIESLKTMAQVFASDDIYGGTSGALTTDFPTSVNDVFVNPPKAAMTMEGDFVPGVATTTLKPITGFNQFPFPSVNGSPPSVVGGGDTVVMFKDSPAARALISFLATPAAATIWAKRGGFSSPNKGVPGSAYTDPLNRATALALANAKIFRFDLSDLSPGAFGGTQGSGEWKILADFLKNPKNVTGTAAALEKAAAAAYK
jgi:ABC-type glycerol-3-phosphate transport system substrate-binding protein